MQLRHVFAALIFAAFIPLLFPTPEPEAHAATIPTADLVAMEGLSAAQVARIFGPRNADGGWLNAPVPLAVRGQTPTPIRCKDNDLRSILIIAERGNTAYVRVGACGLGDGGGGPVAYNFGAALAAGSSMEWKAGQGNACAISEGYQDAGTQSLSIVCGAGGPR